MAQRLRPGDRIAKPRGATRVTTERGSFALKASPDFWGMLVAMPLVMGLIVVASRRKRGGHAGT